MPTSAIGRGPAELVEPSGDGRSDLDARGFVVEVAGRVAFLQLRSPPHQLGIARALVPVGLPEGIVVEHEDEDIQPELLGGVDLELRDTERLSLRDVAATPGDEEHAQIAASDPVLRKLLRLVGGRGPPLHRVDGQACVLQRVDDVPAVLLEINERG
jgi:hypothetical protein